MTRKTIVLQCNEVVRKKRKKWITLGPDVAKTDCCRPHWLNCTAHFSTCNPQDIIPPRRNPLPGIRAVQSKIEFVVTLYLFKGLRTWRRCTKASMTVAACLDFMFWKFLLRISFFIDLLRLIDSKTPAISTSIPLSLMSRVETHRTPWMHDSRTWQPPLPKMLLLRSNVTLSIDSLQARPRRRFLSVIIALAGCVKNKSTTQGLILQRFWCYFAMRQDNGTQRQSGSEILLEGWWQLFALLGWEIVFR